MITADKQLFLMRCAQRGYMLEDVLPCVVKQEGEMWTVDETHPSYPRDRSADDAAMPAAAEPERATDSPPPPPEIGGPGTELKALLSFLGFASTPTCSCNARARAMDENEAKEPGWCEANIETILDWLKEQADSRGLPFFRAGAKVLVRRAISNARRKAAQKGNSK